MRHGFVIAAWLAAAAPTGTPRTPDAPTPTDLEGKLATWYRGAVRAAPGDWGVAVANESGQLIWGVNLTRSYIPASTVKVFTTGFARSVLGPLARQRTRVIGVGSLDPVTGEWVGRWTLELNGDPTLDRVNKPGPMLADLAAQLRAFGIRRFTGPLAVSSATGTVDAAYPAVWNRRHWGRLFAPLIGALTINENAVTLTIAPGTAVGRPPRIVGSSPDGLHRLATMRARTISGSRSRLVYSQQAGGHWVISGTIGVHARPRTFTSVSNAPRAVLEAAWAEALTDAGIEWDNTSPPLSMYRSDQAVLAEVFSAPFDSVASEINRRSLNIGAELMLRWAAGGDGGDAAARLTEHVQRITGDLTGVHLVDGSGLSTEDRATPWSFVSYLVNFSALPEGRNFALLLPANGTGTLRRLGTRRIEPGVVRAKTGTLGNAATLVGYLGQTDGTLVISLLYNGNSVYAARQQQWRLFRLLGANGVAIPAGDDVITTAGSE